MPHFNLWESCCFAEVPDGPQTYTLNVLWLQEEGAKIHMSGWSQSFTLTKNVEQRFHPLLTPPAQWTDSPIRWRCLLNVLCPVRRPVTALDCVLLKDRYLALAPQLVRTVCRQDKILHLQGIEETFGHPAHNLVTVPKELAHFLWVYQVT